MTEHVQLAYGYNVKMPAVPEGCIPECESALGLKEAT